MMGHENKGVSFYNVHPNRWMSGLVLTVRPEHRSEYANLAT